MWFGGSFALAAGTVLQDPPALPSRELLLTWTGAVFALTLAIVLMRRHDVEAQLPEDVRRSIDDRYILIGVAMAASVLVVAGYVRF